MSMKRKTKSIKFIISVLFILLLLKLNTSAQHISIKTVPIASGNQFLIFPSENMGMGEVSIALNDLSLDLFINPAKGSLTKGVSIFSSPVYFSTSQENSSAQTFPLGFRFTSEAWFGSALIAAQQLDISKTNQINDQIHLRVFFRLHQFLILISYLRLIHLVYQPFHNFEHRLNRLD